MDLLYIGEPVKASSNVRVSGDQPMDDVNLLDGRFDASGPGIVAGTINGPELFRHASGGRGDVRDHLQAGCVRGKV